MYYVVIADCYDRVISVKECTTRNQAVEYIANLPDDYYSVTLTNDEHAIKTLKF